MFIYKFICRLYSIITYSIENNFLKRVKASSNKLEIEGLEKLKLKNNNLKLGESKQEIKANNYHYRTIYSDIEIFKFLEKLFDENLRNKIKNLTGFNYSIDYFGAYKNFPIISTQRNKGFYANHYHFDKPYSKNLLKVFIPLDTINKDDGPLEIINKKESDLIKKRKINLTSAKKFYFTGDSQDILLCKANLCFHKAGIPKDGKYTNLLMLQLNPSLNWKISKDLYKRQFKIEPKFTSISNLISTYKLFK